jgi:hypothetical protein
MTYAILFKVCRSLPLTQSIIFALSFTIFTTILVRLSHYWSDYYEWKWAAAFQNWTRTSQNCLLKKTCCFSFQSQYHRGTLGLYHKQLPFYWCYKMQYLKLRPVSEFHLRVSVISSLHLEYLKLFVFKDRVHVFIIYQLMKDCQFKWN